MPLGQEGDTGKLQTLNPRVLFLSRTAVRTRDLLERESKEDYSRKDETDQVEDSVHGLEIKVDKREIQIRKSRTKE